MLELAGGCARIRTLDPLIKSQLLAQLLVPTLICITRGMPDHTPPRTIKGLRDPLLCSKPSVGLVVHAPHTTYAATTRHRRSRFLFGCLGDHGFGRDKQAGHRCGALKRGAPPASFARRSWSFSLSYSERLDLSNPAFDVGLLAGAFDDRGVFLFDAHPLGAAEMLRVTFSQA